LTAVDKLSFDPRWPSNLRILEHQVVACRNCPRLVQWREEIAETKRKAYIDCAYWGRPVPSFGDPDAQLLIVGLAPGAHGANRTGRMFTGDRSGDFLYRALHEAGFASQPQSNSIADGLTLNGAFITAPIRCVPPDNKPERSEVLKCRPYFQRCVTLLKHLRVVVALGSFAFSEYLAFLKATGAISSRTAFRFGHGVLYKTHPGGPHLLGCYHPSQQNTSTGKLTAEMLRAIFASAHHLIEAGDRS
jgi:uracil-DNA glycosylase family 4